jgi:ATP-binding protein involved in chromosome partitioning
LEIPVRTGGDNGIPIVLADPASASAKALVGIAKAIAGRVSMVALG